MFRSSAFEDRTSAVCGTGIVGLPNVGKSSLINSLKRARAVQVGNRPGVTKIAQEVVLDKKLRLVDSPGLLFSQEPDAATAALHNSIRVWRFLLKHSCLNLFNRLSSPQSVKQFLMNQPKGWRCISQDLWGLCRAIHIIMSGRCLMTPVKVRRSPVQPRWVFCSALECAHKAGLYSGEKQINKINHHSIVGPEPKVFTLLMTLMVLQAEKLDDPVLPVARIVQRCPAEQLMGVYKIPAFDGAEGLLQEIAMVRGKLLPGGLPNVEAAARIVLQVGTSMKSSGVLCCRGAWLGGCLRNLNGAFSMC